MADMEASEFSKSALCGDGACVEIAFVKSSTCSDSACVEAGTAPELDEVFMRNSTDPTEMVAFPKAAWRGFIREVRNGTTLIEDLEQE